MRTRNPQLSSKNISRLGILLLIIGIVTVWFQAQQAVPMAQITIQYRAPEATEATLVWGVNGWKALPQDLQPPNTIVENNVMRTPLERVGDQFVVGFDVPKQTVVDFGITVAYEIDDTAVFVWESADENGDFEFLISNDKVVEITRTLPPELEIVQDNSIEQQLIYTYPNTAVITLIWGVNGWNPLDEATLPPQTTIVENSMQTPLVQENGAYYVTLPIEAGTELNYRFAVAPTDTVAFVDNNLDGTGYTTLVNTALPIGISPVIPFPSEEVVNASPSLIAQLVGTLSLLVVPLLLMFTAVMVLLGFGTLSRFSGKMSSSVHIVSPLTSTRAWGFNTTVLALHIFIFLVYYRGFEYFQRFQDRWEQMPNLKYLFTAVDLRVHDVFVSWYSATILILGGVVAGLCFAYDNLLFRQQGKTKPIVGWLMLGVCFWGLALNEAVGLARQLNLPNPTTQKSLFEPSVIIAFWLPLTLILLFFIIFISTHIQIKENQSAFALILLGGAFVLLPYILIGVEPVVNLGVGDKRPFMVTIAESGMRFFGEFALFAGVVWYAWTSNKRLVGRDKKPAFIIGSNRVLQWLALFIVLLGLTLLFDDLWLKEQLGFRLFQNWPPILIATLTVAFTWQLRAQTRDQEAIVANLYGFSIIVTFLFSFYVAIVHTTWFAQLINDAGDYQPSIRAIFALCFIFLAFSWFSIIKNRLAYLLTILSFSLLLLTTLITDHSLTIVAFIALSTHFLMLCHHFGYWEQLRESHSSW